MSEKQLTIVLIVGLVVQGLLGLGGIYYLNFMVAPDLETQIATMKEEVRVSTGKKNAIKGLEKEIKAATDEITKIKKQIPTFGRAETDDFANLIDRLRRKTHTLIGGATFKAQTRTQGPGAAGGLPPEIFKAQYDFSMGGGFFQLLNFIYHVESETRFLVPEGIYLTAASSNSEKEKPGTVPLRNLKVTMTTLMFKEGMGGPPVDPNAPVTAENPPPKAPEKPVEVPEEGSKRTSTPSPD